MPPTGEDDEALRAEDEALRTVALRNASAIVQARERAEEALLHAKQALEARTRELSHSLSLMRATLESTADGIMVTTCEGRVVAFNRTFLDVWNLSKDAVEGALHHDIVARVMPRFKDGEQLRKRIEEIYAAPSMEALDTLEFADGRVFERFSCPQRMESGIVGRVWSYRDITARKQVEDAMRDEALMLDLLNRTGAAIASTLELQVLLQTVTDAATQLSGAEFGAFFYNTSDERGRSYRLYTLSGAPREAFEKFGQPRATPIFGSTFNGGPPVRIDDVLKDERYGRWGPHHGMPPGHLPVRSYLAVPVSRRNGEPVGGLFLGHSKVGVFTERTERLIVGIAAQASVAVENATLYEETRRIALEREALVEAERAARSEIARVSRLKDEFLATLSHELRTPLTAILGWAKVLLVKRSDAATTDRGLHAIERNAVAQARLIDDLLDMNRIVSGKARLDVNPTDLAGVVEAAIEAIRPAAEAKEIHLDKRIDPNAGPVFADANRLQQVLWNLATNAVKFTPSGGSVTIGLQRSDSHVELSVADSGIGIPSDFLPHVFDRFRQADSSTTRTQGGLGLGLSIVKHLVELHGGTVGASSEGEGRGATFTVRLPLAALRHPQHEPRPAAAAAPPAVDIDLHGLRVLVVDDEADTRDFVSQLLRDCRAEVHTAATAHEALATFERVRPDVLLSDIGLPECDGYELIRNIRRLAPQAGGRTPAIALTAFARSQDRTRAMLSGYQVHLSKPIEPHELVATVASLAGRMLAELGEQS